MLSHSHCGSEVARIRQQIELECEAMQRLVSGLAITASHETIQHKYESLGTVHKQLAQIVGEEKATAITMEIYTRLIG